MTVQSLQRTSEVEILLVHSEYKNMFITKERLNMNEDEIMHVLVTYTYIYIESTHFLLKKGKMAFFLTSLFHL